VGNLHENTVHDRTGGGSATSSAVNYCAGHVFYRYGRIRLPIREQGHAS
jgi:hypothetical protein